MGLMTPVDRDCRSNSLGMVLCMLDILLQYIAAWAEPGNPQISGMSST
jgi:hypothetical protein